MDKFIISLVTIGVVFSLLALTMLISTFKNLFKMKLNIRRLWLNSLILLIVLLLGLSSMYLALFLRTFSLYTKEDKIGKVFAEKSGDSINIYYKDLKRDKEYEFYINGDEWMIEGYILRWNLPLRFLGAKSYYKVTRFSGRSEKVIDKTSSYSLSKEGEKWKFILNNSSKIPFADAAYGIGAFQYPGNDTFYIYINDTGFIIKRKGN